MARAGRSRPRGVIRPRALASRAYQPRPAPRARDETAPRAGLPVLYTLGVNSRAARRKDESVLVKGIRGLLLRAARVECKELLHVDDAIFDECVRVG